MISYEYNGGEGEDFSVWGVYGEWWVSWAFVFRLQIKSKLPLFPRRPFGPSN